MALASLFYLVRGRAAVKRFITQRSQADPATLPYRPDLLDLLKGEKARGRQIHLVTAADQAIADAVAAECGLFDTATGSDGERNLKGETKLAFVRGRFADGFLYAGDGSADLPLFRAARGVLLCDVTAATEAAVAKAGAPVLGRFSRPARSPRDWVRAFRVHQWAKNLLVLVPLFVGHAYNVQDDRRGRRSGSFYSAPSPRQPTSSTTLPISRPTGHIPPSASARSRADA